jgi:hypothetical protein
MRDESIDTAAASITLPQATEALITEARRAAAYLQEEADFNRSWTDSRRSGDRAAWPGYLARRLELAAERERWATAIKGLADICELLSNRSRWRSDDPEDSQSGRFGKRQQAQRYRSVGSPRAAIAREQTRR